MIMFPEDSDKTQGYFMADMEYIKDKILKKLYPLSLDLLLDDVNVENLTGKEVIENNLFEISCFMQECNVNAMYSETIKLYEKYCKYIPANNLFLSNKILNEYELAQGKIILSSRPRRMLVELSTLCNLNCIMCRQREREVTKINPKILDIAVENMPYLERLMWQGGEVFILPYFKQLLLKTLRYPYLQQTITSNFQNIDDQMLDLLTRNSIDLAVSIDGAKKETYESIRIGADFDILIKNLSKLLSYVEKNKSKLRLQINFVVMQSNYKEIPDIVDLAKKFNARSLVFLQCTDNAVLDVSSADIADAMDCLDLAEKKCNEAGIYFASLFSLPSRNKKRVSNYAAGSQKELNNTFCADTDKVNFFCHLPWYELTFFSNNTVSVNCSCDVSYNIAVNEKTSIYDIWNSKEMLETRNIVKNSNIKKGCKTVCGVTALQMRKPETF